ncbi:dTDP-4-amino-4,6-dideoxygalactose transaminase [Candidatus Methanomarinus sp.]|nr:dTDP-4-amino-4,6-dideoxygalactose transaminase [ANME-2 cluster archaeon]
MPIAPNLIPRFNSDYKLEDFFYAVRSVFKSNTDPGQLESIFGNRDYYFTNNGRSSLYVILKSLDLPKGSKIGVPLYSCLVVFDAIIKAGHIPCFIDIDLNNYTLDVQDLEKKKDDLDAIIVIHTFGRPADMDEISKDAGDIPIIEDCAHSLLSDYKEKKTGTIGDLSFFSLAKYISAGGGGMIIVNNNKYSKRIKEELTFLETPTKRREIIHSLYIYIYSFLYHKPWFGAFAFQIGSSVENKVDIASKRDFKVSRIRKSDFGVFIQKLEMLGKKVELQRKKSQKMLNELQGVKITLPYEQKDTLSNFYLFPILFDNKKDRDRAHELLRTMNVDTAKLYSMTPILAKQYYGYEGDCPNTEEFANRVLTIPNYYSLTMEELSTIISAVKKIGGYI